MSIEIKHITWTKPAYEDRLMLRQDPSLASYVVQFAEYHTVIRGTVYAVTEHTSHFQKYWKTYRVDGNGVASDCNSGMGNLPLHYEVLAQNDSKGIERKTVILLSCNDSGEVPRRRPCSMCKARDAAKIPCFIP